MPNRIVRSEILTSDSVNKLSWTGEIFYRRLHSVVDDFGRYDARLEILRSSLYPLKLNKVSEADVEKWMNECSEAGLISLYQVEGKHYLEVLKFGQTLRIKKSKYPECKQMQANASRCMSEKKRIETETEVGVELQSPKIKIWLKKPLVEHIDPLPEKFIESAKEQIYLTQLILLDSDIIVRFWDAWITQNITGSKYYETQDEVYKHFVNSIKNEKFKPPTTQQDQNTSDNPFLKYINNGPKH